jgi:hypothetical protein
MLRDAAQQKVREYIKSARQEGLTWVQVGEALNLRPLSEERGAWIAGRHSTTPATLSTPGHSRR